MLVQLPACGENEVSMTNDDTISNDRLGAFLRATPVSIAGRGAGPLWGLKFAVKDALDIGGYRTGAGNPDWLRTHPPATSNAWAVQVLLDAGGSVVGKTITDELTFSLNGENIHYGTPTNPRAPGRIPGGSSSGSAAAVAGGLVDFALGTDCGGSVRAPASFCGIYGMRPSHGRISTAGVFPLAPSFDTVGWFSRDAKLLQRVGQLLLKEELVPTLPRRLLVAADAFAFCDSQVKSALQNAVTALAGAVGLTELVTVAPNGFADWLQAFRLLQGAEIWAEHGEWIRDTKPNLAPDIRERFEWTSTIGAAEVEASQEVRAGVTERMRTLLTDDAVLCLPTTPGIAPLLSLPASALGEFRNRALSLLCMAGLARLPQINLPLGTIDGCPCGVSILGPRGSDAALLQLAAGLTI
jgi:amidase